MQDFNVAEYFRNKLLEQEDVLDPNEKEDDEAQSAFTKEPEQEEEPQSEEPVEEPKISKGQQVLDDIETRLATTIQQNFPDVNPNVINKKWLLDAIKTVKNGSYIKDEFEQEADNYSRFLLQAEDRYLKAIAVAYFFKYHFPNTDAPRKIDVDEILEHLGYLFDNESIPNYTRPFYKVMPLLKQGTWSRNYKFDDSLGIVVSIK